VQPNQWATHFQQARYGTFLLTDAIRPAPDPLVVPRQGYRLELYRDQDSQLEIPMLAAAVSRERLFDTFLDLLQPLGPVVDVILETSHDTGNGEHRDLFRENIDLPVLMSYLCDHEDLLLHDGCTGIAVLAENERMEVQFDEHKLLVVYADDLQPFQDVLNEAGVRRDDRLRFITEASHLHRTHPRYAAEFEQLCYRLGIGELVEQVQ
jgi:hypothetical protein